MPFVRQNEPSNSGVTRKRPRTRNVDWDRVTHRRGLWGIFFKMSAMSGQAIVRKVLMGMVSSKGFDRVGRTVKILTLLLLFFALFV